MFGLETTFSTYFLNLVLRWGKKEKYCMETVFFLEYLNKNILCEVRNAIVTQMLQIII